MGLENCPNKPHGEYDPFCLKCDTIVFPKNKEVTDGIQATMKDYYEKNFPVSLPCGGDTPTPDAVNSPPHYVIKLNGNSIECLDVLEALGLNEDLNCGSAFQYVWRAKRKGRELEDLKKARYYLNRAIERLEAK